MIRDTGRRTGGGRGCTDGSGGGGANPGQPRSGGGPESSHCISDVATIVLKKSESEAIFPTSDVVALS